MLLTNGVPKSKQMMRALVSLDKVDVSDQETYDCLSNVNFVVHPQQINIRDRDNGQIIASIAR